MAPKKQQPQYVMRFAVENFKNIKFLDIKMNRYVTKFTGANGAGKTSALEGFLNILAARKTTNPALIRKGESKGGLYLETDTHIVTRNLDADGGGLKVKVKESNTLIEDPVKWLKDLTGELGYDPLEFMRMKPEDQFDVLKGIVPEAANLEELEVKNSADYQTITDRNAEVRRLKATLSHVAYDSTLPAEPVDIDALLSEARAMESFNANIDAQRREREGITNERNQLVRSLETSAGRIAELRAELQRLEKEDAAGRKDLGSLNEQISSWKPLPQPQDRRALDEKISDAVKDNTLITTNNRARQEAERFTAEIRATEEELEKLKKNIRDRKLVIGSTLEKAKWPVPGLGFATEEAGSNGRELKNPKKVVTYKGLPLSEASTGEQIRVSAAIGMAGQPDLRFLLIREGSLLDDEGMAILEKMAYDNGYQILMEIVDSTGKVGVYLEDGEVAAVNAEPEAIPPPVPPKRTRAKKGVVEPD